MDSAMLERIRHNAAVEARCGGSYTAAVDLWICSSILEDTLGGGVATMRNSLWRVVQAAVDLWFFSYYKFEYMMPFLEKMILHHHYKFDWVASFFLEEMI